jgi:hypothetical protein
MSILRGDRCPGKRRPTIDYVPYSSIPKKKVADTEAALRMSEARMTLKDAVKALAPTISERHGDGIPLDQLYRTIARKLGASRDAVGKIYREIRDDTEKAPRRKRSA